MTKRLTNKELTQKLQEAIQNNEFLEQKLEEQTILRDSLKSAQERISHLINENLYVKGKLEDSKALYKELETSWHEVTTKRFQLENELEVLKSKWYVKLFN